MKFEKITVAIFVLVFLTGVTAVFGQNPNQQLRRSQDLQRAGQQEDARRILESLQQSDPQNIVYYNQLLDLLFSIKDWDGALALVQRRKEQKPNDPALSIDEARVLYRMGRQDEAVSVWRKILKSHPAQQVLVQQVAGAMMTERCYDEAIRVYLDGRKELKKPDLFALNLAGLYAATIQYGRSTGEYLNYLKAHPEQASYIESQIIRFPKTVDVVRSVEAALGETGDDPLFLRILSRFYLEAGLYEKAYQAVRKQDAQAVPKERGFALHRFAVLAQKAGAAETGIAAYREILTRYPDFPASDAVWLGLGKACEAHSDFPQALSAYEAVASRFPKSPFAPQALSRKGVLLRDEVFDLAAAREAFQTLVRQYPKSPEAAQARLDLGECDALAGDLASAEGTYKKILESEKDTSAPLAIYTRKRLAEIYFWKGNFDKALEMVSPFSGAGLDGRILEHPDLNDALQLRLLIQTHKTKDPEALRLYAAARNFQNQRKIPAAILSLDTLCVRYFDRPLAAEALFMRADLFRTQNHPHAVVADLDTLLAKFPDHLLADQALFRSAQIFEEIGKSKEAAGRYERLLSDYPASLLCDEARERIRALERGRA